MDYLFSTPAAAEDLTNAKAVLIIHVVHRGYNLGTFLGLGTALVLTTVKAVRRPASLKSGGAAVAQASPLPLPPPGPISPLAARFLGLATRGSVYGLAFGALAVTGRMWGREMIEWQDRSWRLLSHAGQTQTDHWSLTGGLLGGVVGVLVARRMPQRPIPVGGTAGPARNVLMTTMAPRAVVLGATAIGSALGIITIIGVRVLTETGKNSKAMS